MVDDATTPPIVVEDHTDDFIAEPEEFMTWECLTPQLTDFPSEAVLDDLGAQGWELISIQKVQKNTDCSLWIPIFKKPHVTLIPTSEEDLA